MTQRILLSLGALALAATAPAQGWLHAWNRVDSFRPLASFNLPSGVAEIVDSANNGKLLVVTNAGDSEIAFVDISKAHAPVYAGAVAVNGEPTSVSVAGDYAFANVWVDLPDEGSAPPAFLPGNLVVIDLRNPAAPAVVGTVDIGYHPDSCKAKKVGNDYYVITAIENQPVVVQGGVVTDGEDPGDPDDISPAGLIQVVKVDVVNPANSVVTDVPLSAASLSAAGCLFPDDPQPEFVDWRGNRAAVSLQENNGVADARHERTRTRRSSDAGLLVRQCLARARQTWSRTTTSSSRRPTRTTRRSSPTPVGNVMPAGSRFPDALAFSPDGTRIYTADEGELNFTGGRGFSWWGARRQLRRRRQRPARSSSPSMLSHYPEGRSENKGIEIEGVHDAVRFGGRDFLFVSSERGSYIAVYRDQQRELAAVRPDPADRHLARGHRRDPESAPVGDRGRGVRHADDLPRPARSVPPVAGAADALLADDREAVGGAVGHVPRRLPPERPATRCRTTRCRPRSTASRTASATRR